MNIKNKKVHFLPIGLIIGVFGIVLFSILGGRGFANTAKRINVLNPTVDIRMYGANAWGHTADININMNVDNNQDVNAGDYIEIDAINHSLDIFNSNKLYKDNTHIATFTKVSTTQNFDGLLLKMENINNPTVQGYRQEDFVRTDKYRITFNENAKSLKDISLSLSSKGAYIGVLVLSNRSYEINYNININEKEANRGVRRVNAIDNSPQTYRASQIGGEENTHSSFFWVNVEYRQPDNSPIKLENGDILTFEFTDKDRGILVSGVKVGDVQQFGSGGGYFRNNVNPNGIVLTVDSKLKVRVEEVSDYKVKYVVVEAPVGAYGGKALKFIPKVLDIASNLTPDGNNIKPVPYKIGIYRPDGSVKIEREASVGGAYRRVSSSAAGTPRGSVIVRLRDEENNPITGHENDIILAENKDVGTQFEYQPIKIENYDTPEKVTGEIKQGLNIIVVKYKKSIPAPIQPAKPKEAEPKPAQPQAPNTGFEKAHNLLLPLFGILATATYFFIRKK